MTDAEGNRQAFQNRSRPAPPVLPSQYPRIVTSHVGMSKIGDFNVVSGPIAEMAALVQL